MSLQIKDLFTPKCSEQCKLQVNLCIDNGKMRKSRSEGLNILIIVFFLLIIFVLFSAKSFVRENSFKMLHDTLDDQSILILTSKVVNLGSLILIPSSLSLKYSYTLPVFSNYKLDVSTFIM